MCGAVMTALSYAEGLELIAPDYVYAIRSHFDDAPQVQQVESVKPAFETYAP